MSLPLRDSVLIQIVDAALADTARRSGAYLACRPGCSQCCHGAFAINALDVVRLREGMKELRESNPELAGRLELRAQRWIHLHGPSFPGNVQTGVLGTTDAEQEAFEDFANEAPCPALDPFAGTCDVYAWRPMTCRVFGPPVRNEGGALGCCELCFVGAADEEVAACEMVVPHELEAEVLGELFDQNETVVAFALRPVPDDPFQAR